MIDDVHGYALSGQDPDAYLRLRTNDGGRHWTDITPGAGTTHPSGPISIVVALDEGAAAGSQGQALYTSSDGGHSWRFVSRTDVSRVRPRRLPFGCDKSGFGFSMPSRGWAGGYCAGGYPFFYRTDDGGHSWRRQSLSGVAQCACEVSAPRFFAPRIGVLYVMDFTMNGGGKPFVHVYWTSDGGTHWRAGNPHAGRATGAVSFADSRTAWFAANPSGGIRGPFNRLFRTSDAGRRWQTLKLPFDAEGYQLDAVSATVAYALRPVDGSSSIRLTRDGGRSWQTIRAVRSGS